MLLNPESFNARHRQPLCYLKWNITKLPKPALSSVSPKLISKDILRLSSKLKLKSLSRSPKRIVKSGQDLFKKAKLYSSILSREVFVMQDGTSVKIGQKFIGFHYPILLQSSRVSHLEEMRDFFRYCKEFFRSQYEFAYLFSHAGRRLKCLHETGPESKVVVVSESSVFHGISEEFTGEERAKTRSPVYRRFPTETKHFIPRVTETVNSNFEFSVRRFSKAPEISLPRVKPAKIQMKKFDYFSKIGSLEKLKLKLNEDLSKIDKAYPAIHNQGMSSLKSKYKFKEGKIHSLSAKFKTLVLLSCAINPSHRISSGISRVSFIDYNSSSEEQKYVLGRIFDTFDKDSGGTISWDEFMTAMSIMYNGTFDQKIDLFFNVYDQDGSGSLSFQEIKELCKVQLQAEPSDKLIEELSQSFASLIFDVTETPYDGDIPSSRIKEIIKNNKDKSLIDMFCSFQFLKF
jgi:Ca2+-binding EF-hand superfamily protein